MNGAVRALGGFPQQLRLQRSVWKTSWTFSVDGTWENILLSLRFASVHFLHLLDPNVHIQEHRELHVSWH